MWPNRSRPSPPPVRTIPLLRYWSLRYVLVLFGSLLVLAVIASVWMRQNAFHQTNELLEVKATQYADSVEQTLLTYNSMDKLKLNRDIRKSRYPVQLLTEQNTLWLIEKGYYVQKANDLPQTTDHFRSIADGQVVCETLTINGVEWLRVGAPLSSQPNGIIGLFISIPAQDVLPSFAEQNRLMALFFLGIGLAGWLVIYFLSRKLTAPLRQLSQASQAIAEGSYDFPLPQQAKEQEVQQLVLAFRDMASRLQQLEQLRNELLAGVSHELRTPITSIRGMVQAVQSQVVTGAEADEFLQITLDEAKRLQAMVEDLLNVSSIEAGATPLQRIRTNVSELVEEVLQQLSVLPAFRHVTFARDLPPDPVWAQIDPAQMRQVLLNLLNNSRNACPVEDAKIRLTLRVTDGEIRLDVQDNGRGIPELEQPYVFERFYRVDKKAGGLGLGLTISRLLTRAHGGDLTLVSSSPAGTTFRLSIPHHE